VEKPIISSQRSTPKPTVSQVKKINNHVDDFYIMMNRDTENEIMKTSKSPYEQKNFLRDRQIKKEKQRKNP